MRALVLAAGRGSRLGTFTADRPKCLVDVAGRALLQRQVAALRAAGARQVGVITGWCSDAFAGSTLELFENPRWAQSTMVESLAAAEEWLLAGPVLVSYGDIVYSAATARRLAEAAGPLAISYDPHWEALWRSRFEQPLDDAETFVRDARGDLVDIGGRPSTPEEVQGQYLGLLKFTPRAWSVVRALRAHDAEARELDMTGLLRRLVRSDLLAITTVACDGPWCEFDDPSDLDVGLDIVRELDESLAL
jgi:choline kinase